MSSSVSLCPKLGIRDSGRGEPSLMISIRIRSGWCQVLPKGVVWRGTIEAVFVGRPPFGVSGEVRAVTGGA